MRVFGGEHELKLLNLTVIFYLISGALVFHWLGEFDGPPSQSSSSNHLQPLSSQLESDATQKQPDQADKQQKPPRDDKRPSDLAQLRLASVRRMWNITNQLNILYEANWTELVLAELVEFERQFVESLEKLVLRESDPGESGLELELELEVEAEKKSDAREKENEKDRDKSRKSPADQKVAVATKKRHLEDQQRMKSIKRALVHSLATITTMGSPVQAPRSQLGRLLTILYGALGIPLLVVTVAKSGHRLADSSLNSLLIVRHYCISLPIHFLCCSCNLFMCLRWLSWCCCCCCCSYLCCLADRNKRKCCDYANAPKLRLIGRPSGERGRRGRGAKTRLRLNKINQHQVSAPPPESGSYVIGFNLNNHQGGGEQQKSVRFVDGDRGDAIRQRELDCENSAERHKDYDDDGGSTTIEMSREQSSSLLLTSCSILALYLAVGAYYRSTEQSGLSFVDALFACYAMLATSTLPDSFHLDRPFSPAGGVNPFNYYKTHIGGGPNHLLTNFTNSTQLNAQSPLKPSKPRGVEFSQEVKLTIDSLYLLIGLNLISACAQFARLWFNGIAQERLAKDQCPNYQTTGGECDSNKSHCNGVATSLAPTTMNEITSSTALMVGSYDHQNLHAAPGTQSSHCPPASYNNNHNHYHHHGHQPSPPVINGQINLAELFVMQGGEQVLEAPDQPGASFASSSASSQPRSNASLCARHQQSTSAAAAAYHALASGPQHTSETGGGHLHLALDQATLCSGGSLARRPSAANHHRRQASQLELDQIDLLNKIKPSSSSFQLADCGQQQQLFGTMRPDQQNYRPAMTNGFSTTGGGQHSVEPDSSPNTFDTNSQTMSSMSSRANTMMQPARTGPQASSGGVNGERTISWYGQVDTGQ